MGSLGSGELVIVLIIVLLVFGGSQLPKLARNLGKAQKEFKEGLAEGMRDDKRDDSGDDAGDDKRDDKAS